MYLLVGELRNCFDYFWRFPGFPIYLFSKVFSARAKQVNWPRHNTERLLRL